MLIMYNLSQFSLIIACTYYGYVECGRGVPGLIGIEYNPPRHQVVGVYRNSPADKAGILPRDVVLHINDVAIHGPAGTKINLTILRKQQVLGFEIERIPAKEIDFRHENK